MVESVVNVVVESVVELAEASWRLILWLVMKLLISRASSLLATSSAAALVASAFAIAALAALLALSAAFALVISSASGSVVSSVEPAGLPDS